MASKLSERPRPGFFLKLFLKAPILLYRVRLGFLLGGRFLLLHQVGAKTGLPRRTVLEVVAHDEQAGTWTLAVGFGEKSSWFKNLVKTPDVAIEAGLHRHEVRARTLSEEEGGLVMVDYAHRNPGAAKALMRFCGFQVDGSDDDYRQVATLGLRFVRLEPRNALPE